ncbi:MAG: hypothetical protein KF768_12665 [Phycisphaeraceae bacterium]|nr:hypothetical protein [Phycisphaeraceae bacterium]
MQHAARNFREKNERGDRLNGGSLAAVESLRAARPHDAITLAVSGGLDFARIRVGGNVS